MIKERLLALPLSLALALAGASAVMAQDDAEEAPDMSEVPEYSTAAGQWVYSWLVAWMEASEVDPAAELADLDTWYGGLGEADADDLAEAHVASQGINALQTEINDGDFLDLDDEGSDDDSDEEESE